MIIINLFNQITKNAKIKLFPPLFSPWTYNI